MEWTECLRGAIAYMEKNLMEDIGPADVAQAVHISPFYLQHGFRMVTGYTLGEYLRCRRLYLAALDVLSGSGTVLETAYKYGYDTPESFTKAFTRFHGLPPTQVRKNPRVIRAFLPLTIKIQIQGGNEMDYKIEKMEGFELIGFVREFRHENSYGEIPKFWDEVMALTSSSSRHETQNEVEKAIFDHKIGEFGACFQGFAEGRFFYMIGGIYKGGPVPLGMATIHVPAADWAKFRCVGPLPGALQSVNTKVFSEWLPGNPDYELSMPINLEWYSMDCCPDSSPNDYESGVWLPVRAK